LVILTPASDEIPFRVKISISANERFISVYGYTQSRGLSPPKQSTKPPKLKYETLSMVEFLSNFQWQDPLLKTFWRQFRLHMKTMLFSYYLLSCTCFAV